MLSFEVSYNGSWEKKCVLPKEKPTLVNQFCVGHIFFGRIIVVGVAVAVSFTIIPLWHHNILPQKIGMPRPNELLVMNAKLGTANRRQRQGEIIYLK